MYGLLMPGILYLPPISYNGLPLLVQKKKVLPDIIYGETVIVDEEGKIVRTTEIEGPKQTYMEKLPDGHVSLSSVIYNKT